VARPLFLDDPEGAKLQARLVSPSERSWGNTDVSSHSGEDDID